MLRVEGQHRPLHNRCNALHAFCAARRALVNARLLCCHSLRIVRAIRVAAAGALRLGQHSVHTGGQA